jgi:hypothetical protein
MSVSKFKIVAAGLVVGASALAGAASAANAPRLSDVAYIAASRCEGLAQGAKVDTTSIKQLMVNQDNDRIQYILDKATEAREDGQRQASHAQGYTLESVNNELNGSCKAFLNG